LSHNWPASCNTVISSSNDRSGEGHLLSLLSYHPVRDDHDRLHVSEQMMEHDGEAGGGNVPPQRGRGGGGARGTRARGRGRGRGATRGGGASMRIPYDSVGGIFGYQHCNTLEWYHKYGVRLRQRLPYDTFVVKRNGNNDDGIIESDDTMISIIHLACESLAQPSNLARVRDIIETILRQRNYFDDDKTDDVVPATTMAASSTTSSSSSGSDDLKTNNTTTIETNSDTTQDFIDIIDFGQTIAPLISMIPSLDQRLKNHHKDLHYSLLPVDASWYPVQPDWHPIQHLRSLLLRFHTRE
jgi:hypothetical protein